MTVVFDVGSVLIHAYTTWDAVLAASGLRHSDYPSNWVKLYDFPSYEPYEKGEMSIEQYIADLAEGFGLDSHESAHHLHRSIIGNELEGVPQLLADVKAAGHFTATLSNNNPLHWAHITNADHFPGIGLIDAKVASYQLGYVKPQLEIFTAFSVYTGTQGFDTIFFDDAYKNIEAANEAGWKAVHIESEATSVATIRAALNLD
ncbi:MAG TPA: HAD-IA family hydrolase [Fimbriimonas sp.]|nr:HAD-IA family hydrolase [Fimbriimonas sp.]